MFGGISVLMSLLYLILRAAAGALFVGVIGQVRKSCFHPYAELTP